MAAAQERVITVKSNRTGGLHLLASWVLVLLSVVRLCSSMAADVAADPSTARRYTFEIAYMNVSRLCHSKAIVAVNGRFPGPTICVREGERVIVDVINRLPDKNITIHWHGVRQLHTCWSDGPAYVTQCPIRPSGKFTYNFTIVDQRGTLLWHAHLSWLRVTVYGAFIILPKLNVPYPFPKPDDEVTILLGEWWNVDVEEVIKQALQSGGTPTISDAYTINGQPGLFYPCSSQDVSVVQVMPNKTYLLRVINAALNNELFFAIAAHNMTVVEVDAVYTKPLETSMLVIAPGQTVSALLSTTGGAAAGPIMRFTMAASPHITAANVSFDNTTATAILEYVAAAGAINSSSVANTTALRVLPAAMPTFNDTAVAANFNARLRSLASAEYPAAVPAGVDRQLFYTIGLGRRAGSGKLAASVNNISFVLPANTSLLEAYYGHLQRAGVFTLDFPDNPPFVFNYTGIPPANLATQLGTRLARLAFGSRVQVVLQDTSLVGTESHPIHLHGFNFHVVGQGLGNFDPALHPASSFNLLDPPERNTVAVPAGGWSAIRFTADNPGIWLMHCHLDVHTSWGLDMAFLVEDGDGIDDTLVPPPKDLPFC